MSVHFFLQCRPWIRDVFCTQHWKGRGALRMHISNRACWHHFEKPMRGFCHAQRVVRCVMCCVVHCVVHCVVCAVWRVLCALASSRGLTTLVQLTSSSVCSCLALHSFDPPSSMVLMAARTSSWNPSSNVRDGFETCLPRRSSDRLRCFAKRFRSARARSARCLNVCSLPLCLPPLRQQKMEATVAEVLTRGRPLSPATRL